MKKIITAALLALLVVALVALLPGCGGDTAQAKQYMNELVRKGLIVLDQKHCYRTTKKGLEFLEKCAECPLFHWDLERIRSS